MGNAIEELCFVPHDVYHQIFRLPGMKEKHSVVMARLDYSALKNLVEKRTRRILAPPGRCAPLRTHFRYW